MTTPTQHPIAQPATHVSHRPEQLSQDRQSPASLPSLLFALALVSLFLTVTVGGALFFFPEFAQPRWLWPLRPYNTRFLGAIYLAAAVGFTRLLSGRRGDLARLIVPMLFIFTTNALMVSCLQLQQFNVARRATDIWFWLYIADCVGGAYYLGYYQQYSFSGLRRLSGLWPLILGLQAGILGAFGLSLLFFPVTTGAAWLWPLDVFHSQFYSSIFLAGALGAAILSRWATASELKTLGAIQTTFSVLVIIGVWLVDKEVRGIDWSLLASWAWLGVLALLGIVGVGLIRQSRAIKKIE